MIFKDAMQLTQITLLDSVIVFGDCSQKPKELSSPSLLFQMKSWSDLLTMTKKNG